MVTPYKTQWGITIYQKWIQSFNPNYLVGLKLLVWLSLHMLLLEYCPLEFVIANLVWKLHGVNITNIIKWGPKFCVALDLDVGWVAKVDILRLDCKVEVLIDYEWYLIFYRLSFGLEHLIKDLGEGEAFIEWYN